MVKGISKQVIVVHAPDEKLFEQAIFILNERAIGRDGVTDDALMKEAQRIMGAKTPKKRLCAHGTVWALGGAFFMGAVWLLTVLL